MKRKRVRTKREKSWRNPEGVRTEDGGKTRKSMGVKGGRKRT